MTLFDILQDTAGVREKVPSKNAPPPTFRKWLPPRKMPTGKLVSGKSVLHRKNAHWKNANKNLIY